MWTTIDGDQYWKGILHADSFRGDGSKLTGITTTVPTRDFATSGAATISLGVHAADLPIHTDAKYFATSGAVSCDYSLLATSGAATISLGVHVANTDIHTGTASFATSGAVTASMFGVESSVFAASGAALTDTSVFATSGAATVSLGVHAADTNIHTGTASFATSGALSAHTGDSSDPHGATLTQTTITATTASITGDTDASGAARVRSILIGTEASPGTASAYPQGTLYFQYTA